MVRREKICTKEDIKKPQFLSYGGNNVYLFDIGGTDTKSEYVGLYDVVVQTQVGYQNLERSADCPHLRAQKEAVHPLTAKVSVAAKISFQHDDHLETEADNYNAPPNISSSTGVDETSSAPFTTQFLLGPSCLSFTSTAFLIKRRRVARIMALLLEKCGEPIKFEELSIDDK
jgi:hypothetical protein